MRSKTILILFLFFLPLLGAYPQQSGPKKEKSSLKSERKVRKELRLEAREKRRKERAERKAVKQYHKRLQTRKVRKRMSASKKTAIRNNEHKREFFVKRWFKKKKKI